MIPELDFVKLGNVEARLDQPVNLVGVVIETGLPRTTKGTDLFCPIKIVDESRPTLGFFIHFFAETVEKLPHVETVGDIILVSNVVVKKWESGYYALYQKKTSSFALFEGSSNSIRAVVPYEVSSGYVSVHTSSNFRQMIMGFKKWSIEQIFDDLNDLKSLKMIKDGELCNLRCKILHICEVKENEWIIYIWDGTDAPPVSMETKFENGIQSPFPLQLEATPLSRNILSTFPCVGTVLRMLAYLDKNAIKLLKTNKWAKILNIQCEVHSTLWRAVLMPFSKFCHLRDDDESAVARQRCYEERVLSRFGRMPMSCFPWASGMTETLCNQAVPFVTLMDVVTYPEVVCKYRCVVRILAMVSWKPEEFGDISILRLTLEDPTTRIYAFAYSASFLGDISSIETFRLKRKLLLGIGDEEGVERGRDVVINPPWIQCCLVSFYHDENNPWGTRDYQIFHTKFVSNNV